MTELLGPLAGHWCPAMDTFPCRVDVTSLFREVLLELERRTTRTAVARRRHTQ
jgi:hypothetical protein